MSDITLSFIIVEEIAIAEDDDGLTTKECTNVVDKNRKIRRKEFIIVVIVEGIFSKVYVEF